ncbi:MAG: prephenate dehydrogenase [Opitutales bacterium]
MQFRQATILGPGLLGASLLQALRAERLAKRLTAWARRPETRLAVEQHALADTVFPTPAEAVAEADLVVVCTPVDTIVPLLEEVAPAIPEGCLVTDVGSTKSLICRHGRAALTPKASFIGSHPMAGSEKTGLEHARADLFHHRPCFVTPVPGDPDGQTERLVRLWTRLGMEVTTASPERHDETVAAVSHLPHLLASVLCSYLGRRERDERPFAGNGLRDSTRIASGDPRLWKSISRHNNEEICAALGGFADALQELRGALENQDYATVERILSHGKRYRDGLL